jgi:hypothetical protein
MSWEQTGYLLLAFGVIIVLVSVAMYAAEQGDHDHLW